MDCRPTKPLLQLQENHAGAMSIEQQPICYLRSLVLQGRQGSVNASLGCSEANKDLTSRHPSKLPPCFVAAGLQLVPPKTNKTNKSSENANPHGQWKKQERFAIRGVGAVDSRCRYIGVKTILDFEPHTGIGKKRGKDRWIMIQYQNLREEGTELVIEKEISLCKVLFGPKGKGNLLECLVPVCPASVVHFGAATQLAPPHPSSSTVTITAPVRENLEDIEKFLDSSDFEEQLACHSGEECLMELDDIYNGFEKALNGSQDPGRKLEISRLVNVQEKDTMVFLQDQYNYYRMSSGCEEQSAGVKSKVWDYFTKIFEKQINKKGELMFAACHKCDQVLMANPKKHGTSRLLKHHEANAK